MLKNNDIILLQVASVCGTGHDARFCEHPADVRPPQATMGTVRVQVSVGISVMSPMMPAPPFDRTLYGTRTGYGEDISQRFAGLVGSV